MWSQSNASNMTQRLIKLKEIHELCSVVPSSTTRCHYQAEKPLKTKHLFIFFILIGVKFSPGFMLVYCQLHSIKNNMSGLFLFLLLSLYERNSCSTPTNMKCCKFKPLKSCHRRKRKKWQKYSKLDFVATHSFKETELRSWGSLCCLFLVIV